MARRRPYLEPEERARLDRYIAEIPSPEKRDEIVGLLTADPSLEKDLLGRIAEEPATAPEPPSGALPGTAGLTDLQKLALAKEVERGIRDSLRAEHGEELRAMTDQELDALDLRIKHQAAGVSGSPEAKVRFGEAFRVFRRKTSARMRAERRTENDARRERDTARRSLLPVIDAMAALQAVRLERTLTSTDKLLVAMILLAAEASRVEKLIREPKVLRVQLTLPQIGEMTRLTSGVKTSLRRIRAKERTLDDGFYRVAGPLVLRSRKPYRDPSHRRDERPDDDSPHASTLIHEFEWWSEPSD